MNPIQEIAETIKEFQYRQAVTLTAFEKVMQKKSPEIRKIIADHFLSDGDEMIEHEYIGPYRNYLQEAIQKNCHFYTDHKAEAVMLSYYLSGPKERETFRNNILAANITDRVSGVAQSPKMKEISTEELGYKVMDYQLDLVRPYHNFSRKPMVALNMITELSKQPCGEKEKIKQLIADSLDIIRAGGLEAGVPYLANRLLPYFYKECSQKSAEINRPEKIKRTKSILHSFSWLLLNQDRYNAMNMAQHGLFPLTKKQSEALFKNFDDYDY